MGQVFITAFGGRGGNFLMYGYRTRSRGKGHPRL